MNHLVYSGAHGRAIIFTNTKKEATEMVMSSSLKVDAQALHGDITQKQREITLQAFRDGDHYFSFYQQRGT